MSDLPLPAPRATSESFIKTTITAAATRAPCATIIIPWDVQQPVHTLNTLLSAGYGAFSQTHLQTPIGTFPIHKPTLAHRPARRFPETIVTRTFTDSSDNAQDDLSGAVKEAVSDYVELRGLNGLCPDVRKWSSPPAPAAFLDAGLPKTGGTGSLPRGLLPSVSSSNVVGAPGEFRGHSSQGKNQVKHSGNSSGTSVDNVVSFTQDGSSHVHDGNRRLSSDSRQGVRRRSSLDSVASSIPSPSWEAEGPDGFVSQVMSMICLAPFSWHGAVYQNGVFFFVMNQSLIQLLLLPVRGAPGAEPLKNSQADFRCKSG